MHDLTKLSDDELLELVENTCVYSDHRIKSEIWDNPKQELKFRLSRLRELEEWAKNKRFGV